MAKSAIAPDVHQSFDVHLHFAAYRAFDTKSLNDVSDTTDFFVVQLLDFFFMRNTNLVENTFRGRATNAIDVRECYHGMFCSR